MIEHLFKPIIKCPTKGSESFPFRSTITTPRTNKSYGQHDYSLLRLGGDPSPHILRSPGEISGLLEAAQVSQSWPLSPET